MHPGDGRVVSNFIMQALKNQPITLYGDGQQSRSFCYVEDMIEGLLALMGTSAEVTGPINLGNPLECTVRDLAERIIALTGSSSRIEHHPLPAQDPVRRCPDISLAKNVLGWNPTTGLDDGLIRTIDYFKRLGGLPKSSSG